MIAYLRLLALCCALAAPAALAGKLELPVRVPLDAIADALGDQLAWREGPCRHVKLESPKLESVQGRVRLSAPGTAALGIEAGGGRCQTAANWKGTAHFTLVPRIDDAGRLRVQVIDSRLSNVPPALWDAAKRQLHARLETFAYDLGASREAFARLMPGIAPPQVLALKVEARHVVVPLSFEVPDAWLVSASAGATAVSPAPLTEAELDALEKALEPWDAFVVYIVRQVALERQDEALRQRLFTLLLDSRYQLSELLSGDAVASGDPLRALFLETWGELRAILADAGYTLFVEAGDVLAALEAAAPGLPLSLDGLRQLARSLRPGESADPLAHGWAIDPQLGQLFQVEQIPETAPAPEPARSFLDFFVRSAHADAPPELDKWVPTRDQLAMYEPRVATLLRKTAAGELQRTALPTPYDRIYRDLVPTTALIESCWRQYTVKNGKVSYVRSQSSSVGIMQINQRVWRGFYDVERLRWDTAYNARAGAQILLRYVKDYAIPYAEKTGEPRDVARAAYAVYNAGPRAVGRFAKNPPHPREARVDEKLWTLYSGIAAGGRVDLANCGVKAGETVAR